MSAKSLAEKAAALDAADPLKDVRGMFEQVEGWVYLDANSVGPAPKAARAAAAGLVDDWVHLRRRGWGVPDGLGARPVVLLVPVG